MSDANGREGHKVKAEFVMVPTLQLRVDSEVAAAAYFGPISLAASELSPELQNHLIDQGIAQAEAVRRFNKHQQVFNNSVALAVITAIGSGAAVEAYRSGSNWAKAAYAFGALVCTAADSGIIGEIKDVLHNRETTTKVPTTHIEAMTALRQSLGPVAEDQKTT